MGEEGTGREGILKIIPVRSLKDLMVENGCYQEIPKCFSEDLDSE